MDLNLGGLSYLSSTDLKNALMNVSKSSAYYIIRMAIMNKCPSCDSVINKAQDIAREVNNLSLDQCKMGKMIGQGIFNKINAKNQEHQAMSNKIQGKGNGIFDFHTENNNIKDKSVEKISYPNKYNLLWYLMNKDNSQALDNRNRQLMELTISIMGTNIFIDNSGQLDIESKPAIINKNELEKLFNDDKDSQMIKIYRCDDLDMSKNVKNQCLTLKIIETNLTAFEEVKTLSYLKESLISLNKKIKQGTAIKLNTQNAKAEDKYINFLLDISQIPLVQLIVNEYSIKPNYQNHIYLNKDFIRMLSLEAVVYFLNQIINITEKAIKQGEILDGREVWIKNLKFRVKKVNLMINNYQSEILKKTVNYNNIIESIINNKKRFLYEETKMIDK
jgi:uncharacterized C2H2 Zn-finger protein